ncbi:MAG: hypothetical protein Tsb0021_11160 [Chlamydiales bacterium]
MNFFYQNSRNFNYLVGSYLIEDYLRSDSGLGLNKAEKQLKIALESKTNEAFRNFLLNRDEQTLTAIDPKFIEWKALAQNPDPVIQSCRARIAFGEAIKLAPLLTFALKTATVTQFFGPIPITVTVLTPFIVKSFLALESRYFPNSPFMRTVDKVVHYVGDYIFEIIVAADKLVGLTRPIDLIFKNKSLIVLTAFRQLLQRVHLQRIHVIFQNAIFNSLIGTNNAAMLVASCAVFSFVGEEMIMTFFLKPHLESIYDNSSAPHKNYARSVVRRLIHSGDYSAKILLRSSTDKQWMFSHLETIETLHQEILSGPEEGEVRQEKINQAAIHLKQFVIEGAKKNSLKKQRWILEYAFKKLAQHQFYQDAVDGNNQSVFDQSVEIDINNIRNFLHSH